MSDVDGNTWALHRKALLALVDKPVTLVLKASGCEGQLHGELLREQGQFNFCCANGDRITLHPLGLHSVVGNRITVRQ